MSTGDDQEREPSLQELLADPVVHAVMKADGLEARDLIELVQAVSRNWRLARPSSPARKPAAKRSRV
ncbi:MAG TPA: hypothetical protein VN832_07075 [Stellaceae bacterium]|nr:hypothetical protein [Stellaceae bacterium]